jgi:hypothetical protein
MRGGLGRRQTVGWIEQGTEGLLPVSLFRPYFKALPDGNHMPKRPVGKAFGAPPLYFCVILSVTFGNCQAHGM